ncbi:MAG: MAE_28990/MAE_18760 family HEPN-like nuclease [Rhodomicrobium sp.]
MRSPEDFFEDMERDRSLREREIRLIENITARTEAAEERDMLHRSLILLTYAHFEGFCKFALTVYTSAINSLALPCREACTPLVAATLSKVFGALRDVNSKHQEFARVLPNDRELHLAAREHAFIDKYEVMVTQKVTVSDKLVDTKSNLNTIVLKRNLYQLGLNYPVIENHRSNIDKMLGVRNAIAHGDVLMIPTQGEVADYTSTAFEVMRFIQQEVYQSLRDETYRKRPVNAA